MPVGSITKRTVVGSEVEAIDFCVSLLVGIFGGGIHRLLGGMELITGHHTTAEEHNLGFGVVGTDLLVEVLETIEQQKGIGSLGGGVVGAKIDAHQIWSVS